MPVTGPFARVARDGDIIVSERGEDTKPLLRPEKSVSSAEEGVGVVVGAGFWSFSSPAFSGASSDWGQCMLYGVAHSLEGGVTGRINDRYYAKWMSNGDPYFTAGRVAALAAACLGTISCVSPEQ